MLTSGVFALAYTDDLQKIHSLNFATPLVSLVNQVGGALFEKGPSLWYPMIAALCGSIVLIGILTRDSARRLFFSGVLLAILTQFFLIDSSWQATLATWTSPFLPSTWPLVLVVGLVGYGLSGLFVLRACTKSASLSLEGLQRDSHMHFSSKDLTVMIGIFITALFFRVYALNHIVFGFEGELACYLAGASSLKGMLYANEGVHGPWAPLGILYYLPIYLTTKIFGTTLLAVRLSSALVGVITVPLLYVLVTRIAGKRAGIVAAFLFAMNCLHIGWSRTDVHPHGVTTWPSLLLCFALLRAADTKRLSWYGAVALLMGLTWHQYPSGQAAVTIPVIAVCFYALNNRGHGLFAWRPALAILTGLGLWSVGLPLTRYLVGNGFYFKNPFTLTGPRASWGNQDIQATWGSKAVAILSVTLEHCWDFIQGLFYKMPYMFHQEWLPSTANLTPRSEAWVVVALAMVGLFVLVAQRKRFETAVMFGWCVAALLPGVLSSQAYAKRMSTIYPAVDSLAAIGISCAITLATLGAKRPWRAIMAQVTIAVASVCFIAYTSYVWFSGRFWGYGEPPEIAMAEEMKEVIPAGTIVISDLGQGYDPSKFTFLLLDHLSAPENRPNLVSFYRTEQFPEYIKEPFKAQSWMSRNWVYLWTKLRDQATESESFSNWKYINFLIVDTFHNRAVNSEQIQLATSRCREPSIKRIHSSANTPTWTMMSITSVVCKVSDLL
ncbi:MAG: Dolichyl-phosphate-mannose-protein mannosyltransferase [Pseudomonadota bacterium]|jgi:hypothetical protein